MKNKDEHKAGRCICVFGTGSDVGKSIVATALCRILTNRGFSVAPFKAQNMSNNSGVTFDGLEMGRAQIVQAEAAKIFPHVDMNPILLKPTSETGAQVVLFGKVLKNTKASEYHKKKKALFLQVCCALDRLKSKYDFIIIEGAGSCAEVNLMENDLVNMPIAEYAGGPVILVGDIHKGGVFAQIVGTLECLPEKFRDLISGFIINRFRGDLTLFESGTSWIEEKTGKYVFGVLPWYNHINIEAEDSVVIEKPVVKDVLFNNNNPSIAIIRTPHISNFTDFEPLFEISEINICYVLEPEDLSEFNCVIIPGSKSTISDLKWIEKTGWAEKIKEYAKQPASHILGVCGGYQMMGDCIHDPEGLEGTPASVSGLSLLPVETTLKTPKITAITVFGLDGVFSVGYEIHMGHTKVCGGKSMFGIKERNGQACDIEDGCVSDNKRFMGTYIHGLFDSVKIILKWLASINIKNVKIDRSFGLEARDAEYDLLAEHFEKHIDMEKIYEQVGLV